MLELGTAIIQKGESWMKKTVKRTLALALSLILLLALLPVGVLAAGDSFS